MLSSALEDLLTKKKSMLTAGLFCDLVHRHPAACLDLLPQLAAAAGAGGRNWTVRRSAWLLLAVMAKQPKVIQGLRGL